MGASKFKLNKRGASEILHSQGVRGVLRTKAETVASVARSAAPVASGEYRDSIGVESATTDRAVERVVASAPHSVLVELKTRNLGRALDGGHG